MLPQTQIKALIKNLGIKEEKNAILFLARLEGWIKKNGSTKISLAKGINAILKDIHAKEIKKAEKVKKINLEGIKNNLIIKYSQKIIELHNKGWGARKIEKYLFEMHRAKISYSSIYRFLKQQKEVENG